MKLALTLTSLHDRCTGVLRRRRFSFFEGFVSGMRTPIRVLDCGGTVDFWLESTEASALGSKWDLTIINRFKEEGVPGGVKWHVGDARDLSRFGDGEFDVAFSNSVINFMPSWEDQCRMAKELLRVGKSFFVQSPNYYYPLDWRTLVPFFHFLDPERQAWCFTHFRVGAYARMKDPAEARWRATRVRDLCSAQMRLLFPGCQIFREKWFGFTKSIAAYGSSPKAREANSTGA